MRYNKRGQKWTEEDLDYLREAWGRVAISQIEKVLGRTYEGIYSRVKIMGLGGYLSSGGNYIPVFELLKMLGYKKPTVHWFLRKNPDFPHKRQEVGNRKRRFAMVSIEEFWKWLKKHPDRVSIAYLEPLALGGEEAWVKEKRQLDYEEGLKRPRTCRWTKEEDSRLAAYVKSGAYDAPQIAKILNRTIIAVQRRVPMVTYERLPRVRQRHFWTGEERIQLGRLIANGLTIEETAKEMGLEREQVVAQMWTFYGTRNADTLRQRVKERGLHGAQRNRKREAKAG